MTDAQADKIIALLERIAVAVERPPEGFAPGSAASNDWLARLFGYPVTGHEHVRTGRCVPWPGDGKRP